MQRRQFGPNGCLRRKGDASPPPHGRFLARVTGETRGNALLLRPQYRWADNEPDAVRTARSLIVGKLCHSRQVVERALRDHMLRLEPESLKQASLF
ncbi:MAG: hypothetical protein HFJ80_06275 [Clostridiales bacterium]|nr:hypothetical protein [Clostridiales bacterium]